MVALGTIPAGAEVKQVAKFGSDGHCPSPKQYVLEERD